MASGIDEDIRLSQEPFLEKSSPPYDEREEEFYTTRTSNRPPSLFMIFSLSFNVVLLFGTAVLLYALHVNREANTDPSQLLPRRSRSILERGR